MAKFETYPEKTTPADDDILLLADSADADADGDLKTKKLKVSNIPAPEGTEVKSTGEAGGTKFLREDGDGTCSWQTAGGSAADFTVDFPAGNWNYPTSNPAPLDEDTGTNGTIIRQLFDDTTEEFVEAVFKLPPAIAGTVTFYIEGYAVTAVASKNVEFTFYHSAKADGESWDAAFSSKVSGDLATDGTQDQMDFFSFTETVSNLGWTAGDQVRIKLSRTAPSADNLSGDYGLTHFRISVPRA